MVVIVPTSSLKIDIINKNTLFYCYWIAKFDDILLWCWDYGFTICVSFTLSMSTTITSWYTAKCVLNCFECRFPYLKSVKCISFTCFYFIFVSFFWTHIKPDSCVNIFASRMCMKCGYYWNLLRMIEFFWRFFYWIWAFE